MGLWSKFNQWWGLLGGPCCFKFLLCPIDNCTLIEESIWLLLDEDWDVGHVAIDLNYLISRLANISLAFCFVSWKRVIVKLIEIKILFHRPIADLLSCFDLLARYCFAVLGGGDDVVYYIWDDSNKSENLTVALAHFYCLWLLLIG